MAAPRLVNQLFLNWQDSLLSNAQTGWTLLDQTPMALGPYTGLVGAAQALSRADQQNVTFQNWIETSSGTSSGPFATVRDQAVFQLISENYTRLLAIPAPNEGIFLPDGKTVDMSNSLVVAFIDQVQAVLGDSYGNPWIRVPGGYRRRVVIGGT